MTSKSVVGIFVTIIFTGSANAQCPDGQSFEITGGVINCTGSTGSAVATPTQPQPMPTCPGGKEPTFTYHAGVFEARCPDGSVITPDSQQLPQATEGIPGGNPHINVQ